MQKSIYHYLSKYYDDAILVDRLIISAFINLNKLPAIKNVLIREYEIVTGTFEHEILIGFIKLINDSGLGMTFESLIELFEFVVSPADKIVNGAVYTPKSIREFIVGHVVTTAALIGPIYRLADVACGCGGFLLEAAEKIREITGRHLYDIYKTNLYGVDITAYSIDRCKLLLTLYAIYNGEDHEKFEFNLFTGNSLEFSWKEKLGDGFNGFQSIVGNPPYVASRNMDATTLDLLKNWKVTDTGHPDLYIPFFQIGYENLAPNGMLGLITVNTFIKSVNGRALRQYFTDEQIRLDIINFGGEQIFKDRNTYTCICFLQQGNPGIRYIRSDSSSLPQLDFEILANYNYENLNHKDGWNLVNSESINQKLSLIESIGIPFKKLYNTKNGIATLKNNIYKFKPVKEDASYYYLALEQGGGAIEKGICRNIVNANKLRDENDLIKIQEKIIFPYIVTNGVVSLIDEQTMQLAYPRTYSYLKQHEQLLATRDKSNKKYEAWYAFGRRQSMDIKGYKLFFPHICDKPRFVISMDENLLFYNGIAVIAEDLEKLLVLKKLMESKLFYFYIRHTTKDYASGYISLSRNYIKNFGVYQFSTLEKEAFLKTTEPDRFLYERYGVNLP